jgi:hypothetical protein
MCSIATYGVVTIQWAVSPQFQVFIKLSCQPGYRGFGNRNAAQVFRDSLHLARGHTTDPGFQKGQQQGFLATLVTGKELGRKAAS